jgi:hypothetical protein
VKQRLKIVSGSLNNQEIGLENAQLFTLLFLSASLPQRNIDSSCIDLIERLLVSFHDHRHWTRYKAGNSNARTSTSHCISAHSCLVDKGCPRAYRPCHQLPPLRQYDIRSLLIGLSELGKFHRFGIVHVDQQGVHSFVELSSQIMSTRSIATTLSMYLFSILLCRI